ncbi:hypothetical protein ACLOJK_014648, partial [Asimina triloba]
MKVQMVEMLARLMGVVTRRHLAGMGRGCTLPWAMDLVRWLADGGAAARRRDADGWRACR